MLFQYLAFPCGLIRGALANLGVICVVTAEVTMMPACESISAPVYFIDFYYLMLVNKEVK